MLRIAFICVHNSCRSQMAEAFGRILGRELFLSLSAGTEKREHINPDAVRIMKEIGIDMELLQRPKLLPEIGKVDILITMGCNVKLPEIPFQYTEDWGISDPSGLNRDAFCFARDLIQEKVTHLVTRIRSGELPIRECSESNPLSKSIGKESKSHEANTFGSK